MFPAPRGRSAEAFALYLALTQSKRPFERVVHDTRGIALEMEGNVSRGIITALKALSASTPLVFDEEKVKAVARCKAFRSAYPFTVVPPLPASKPTPAAQSELKTLGQLAESAALDPDTELSASQLLLAVEAVRARVHNLEVSKGLESLADRIERLPATARWRSAAEDDLKEQ